MECKHCGKCCFGSFCRHVGQEDLDDWQEHGRHDIIEMYEKDKARTNRIYPEMRAFGLPLHTCSCIKVDNNGELYCEIYEHRPIVCREKGKKPLPVNGENDR